MFMQIDDLQKFIWNASRSTYASDDKDIRVKQKDLSTTIEYQDGDFSYHDNYFGGEPYGGREVVFYKNKPVWMMVYYGWIEDNSNINVNDVYNILTEALRKSSLDMPYRGPSEFVIDDMKYINKVNGDILRFSGEEKIFYKNQIVYQAKYMGGLIDQR
jgi:hypothetical protein